MEFADAVRARRMCRAFEPASVDPEVVDGLIDLARRHPAAGNSAAASFLVLEGPETADYWAVTLAPERRASFPWPGLLDAPVLVVVLVDPTAYVARYAEPDKARTGLGVSTADWPVPYWFVDGGMAAQNLLLAAADAGLGACFFGLFDHERSVLETFGVPEAMRAVGTVAIGHPAADRPSRSAGRGRPPLAQVLHRGRW
ncbi:MAG: nitroreductase family protein [Acidimicrobiales bacterium]|nr:nitroreductase family protein [Acidimicrobiales bacterium]